ncbi:type II restriction endonuclease subunit M [Rhizobium leguminosarum bv. viciae]|nr:type II restriction endonuclease subunit M [Rhizobium leguminosarum bv. viciae]
MRLHWECRVDDSAFPFLAKGGKYSPYYAPIYLRINWRNDGDEIKSFVQEYRRSRGFSPHWTAALLNANLYFRQGITWPRRTQGGLSLRALPRGCIFGDKGPAAFTAGDGSVDLLSMLAVVNSAAFRQLVSLQMAFGSYEVGVIKKTPYPNLDVVHKSELARLADRAWRLTRTLSATDETCVAFYLPAALRERLGHEGPENARVSLKNIEVEVDAIVFGLYGFGETDCVTIVASADETDESDFDDIESSEDGDDEDDAILLGQTDALLSWATGVSFGRFDLRVATGERDAPPEPDPFDPLPAKSPGMLPDGAAPFHVHNGILVDDRGHPHDLPRLIEEVLARVQADAPGDVRRWLLLDFFPLHLKQYSKSRRKAPIYWPLSTSSGSYTLWLYYPNLTSQTLYIAVNDFVEPKLKQVSRDTAMLRNKGTARSRDDEKAFEALQNLELELIELRDTLLQIAPTYRPNQDDGVQITAAPLWQLFRQKPWQKILRDTWAKLEKGNYDWSHLAMAYWPDRVREKCKTDKSLAIAHHLEHLYVEPEPKSGSKGKAGK